MNIRDYLHVNRIRASDFARKLGVTPSYFIMVKNGKLKPGILLSKQIEIETGGKVTIKELRG